MNYETLKTMIESLIHTYKCPSCFSSEISEKNIDIIGAAGSTVNIDMQCPKCEKHYMARMEVVGMNMADSSKFSKENFQKMQLNLDSLKKAFQNIGEQNTSQLVESTEDSIKDEEIVDLSKNLKAKKLSADDLFSE